MITETPGAIALVAKTPQEFSSNLTPLLVDICADGVCLFGEDFFEPYRRKGLKATREAGLVRRLVGGVKMWCFPSGPRFDWTLTWEGFRDLR